MAMRRLASASSAPKLANGARLAAIREKLKQDVRPGMELDLEQLSLCLKGAFEGSADFLAFEATSHDGTVRKLSKREGMLLKLLIGKEGEVVSREDILQMVWGYDVIPSTRTIDNFILAFRKTYERDPKSPQHFHSVRGVGYKFTR